MRIAPMRAGRADDIAGRSPIPLPTVSGDAYGTMSLAHVAAFGPTLRETARAARAWRKVDIATRLSIAGEAARHLLDTRLPIGDQVHTRTESVCAISRVTGLPHTCVETGFAAVARELSRMESVLCAASPTGTLDIYEDGAVRRARYAHWTPAGDVATVIAPGNVVGAHAVWAPLITAGYPIVLKPSAGDPISPLRIISAFIAAGAPAELFSVLPLHSDDVPMLTRLAPATIAFGDDNTLSALPNVTRAYGPGRAIAIVSDELLLRDDVRAQVLSGMLDDAGRACVNTSLLIVVGDGMDGLRALATDLATVTPKPLAAPDARLGALPVHTAQVWTARLDAVAAEGRHDFCADVRSSGPMQRGRDGVFLLPRLIEVEDDSPALRWEVPAPVAWVVRWPESALTEARARGLRALAVSVFVESEPLWMSLCAAPGIGKVLRGVPSTEVDLRLPHDGFVTDGLYVRKAVCDG